LNNWVRLAHYLNNSTWKGYIVCSRKTNYYNALKSMIDESFFKVYLYREDIHNLMRGCQVIFSKPGGSTLAEVLFLRKVLIMHKVLGGQEEENLKVLKENGVGLVAKDVFSLMRILDFIKRNKFYIKAQKERIKNFYNYRPSLILEALKDVS